MPLFRAWLVAFALTVASELAVAVPLLGAIDAHPLEPREANRARRVAAVCLAQLATHPSVWFIWPLLNLPRPLFLLVAESFALLVEALIYRFSFERLSWSRCFATSALANAASVLVGLYLH
ncbi:MAG TPA: hypothetical protein VER11_24705 [Polyangiaceae bacterium]|nr:hypothetical protein [Polyangiaceae bacterium]